MDIDKNILLGDLLNGNSFEDAAHKPTDKASFIDWSSSWAMYVVFSLDFFYTYYSFVSPSSTFKGDRELNAKLFLNDNIWHCWIAIIQWFITHHYYYRGMKSFDKETSSAKGFRLFIALARIKVKLNVSHSASSWWKMVKSVLRSPDHSSECWLSRLFFIIIIIYIFHLFLRTTEHTNSIETILIDLDLPNHWELFVPPLLCLLLAARNRPPTAT